MGRIAWLTELVLLDRAIGDRKGNGAKPVVHCVEVVGAAAPSGLAGLAGWVEKAA